MNWKEHERRTARRLGGERVAVADKRSDADVLHPTLSIECKHRKKLPTWLYDAVGQAAAAHKDKIPVAVLHQLGQNSDKDLCVVPMIFFERLTKAFEDLRHLEATRPDLFD